MSHQYAFLDSYIGLKYDPLGGDGITTVNCYSLLRMVFKQQRNIDLPAWSVDDSDVRSAIRALRSHIKEQINTKQAMPVLNGDRRDWDIVTVERKGEAHHIGLYMAGGILHAEKPRSAWEPLHSFQMIRPNATLRWWRWPI